MKLDGEESEIKQLYKSYRQRQVTPQGLRASSVEAFQNMVFDFYDTYGREFPWRKKVTPYKILVSEVMLQQTQAPRVVDHFKRFLHEYPRIKDLAKASRAEVIRSWQGLGFNRRALNLHETAKQIVSDFHGRVPRESERLREFPGIGAYTSRSIPVFAYGSRELLVETNIRALVIFYFQKHEILVSEKVIEAFMARLLPEKDCDTWYNALMDLGSLLKSQHPELNGRSAIYQKQKPFKGSRRELRGNLLRLCSDTKGLSAREGQRLLEKPLSEVKSVLNDLLQEGFVEKRGSRFCPIQE